MICRCMARIRLATELVLQLDFKLRAALANQGASDAESR